MKFEVKLEYYETLKLNLIVAYRHPIMLFITLVGLGMMFTVIDYLTLNTIKSDSFPFMPLIFGTFFIIGLPLTIVLNTKQNLKKDKFLSQRLIYEIDTELIKLEADTFSMTYQWTHLSKIIEYKNWFLLYTSKTHALLIPKDRLQGVESIAVFREFFSKETKHNSSLDNISENDHKKRNILGKILGAFIMTVSSIVIFILIMTAVFLLFDSEFQSFNNSTTFGGLIFFLMVFVGLFISGRKLYKKNVR